MTDDEAAIRDLIATWLAAGKSGNTKAVLGLIHDDALFHVPGAEPFGKAAFASASEQMTNVRMEGESQVLEIEVCGDTAWCRTHLAIVVTPPAGQPVRRAGYTLSILRKSPAGKWQLFRDANMLAVQR
ncbi:MAG: SgcJ/EcaC family oxidoreductase [Alphaproteobacteria bacterium]|nr:SgcJ/EcaC family oxidoreductase [Alphaproteobacteria bacterium]